MFIIVLIMILAYLTWRLGTRNFGYWKTKNVKHDKPLIFFGNMYKQFTRQMSLSQQFVEWHEKYPEEKYIGVHMANDLGLVLRDPELIKRVLITDFKYFHQRGIHSHKLVREHLLKNLFTADGDAWRLVRQRVTPAFSGAKIKAMFPLIERTAQKMLSVTKEGNQDVKELMAKYTTDFIGTCGFGLDFDTLNDETSVFRQLGRRIFKMTTRDTAVHIVKRLAPELFKHVNYFTSEIEKNTMYLVKQILNKRNYMPSGRHDFIDLLLELKQKGKIIGESIEHFNPDGSAKVVEFELDDWMIMAQAFVFFAAGFETSSAVTSFLLHELAFNPEVQKACHKEIDEILIKHGGKISYEAVMEMVYLESALRETMRLHPNPAFLIRRCAKKYTFPETALSIDEDVYVLIVLECLHRDPTFFEDPEIFRPERFQGDEFNRTKKHVFMPFGEGPRACIGERLGMVQSLAGVAALLSRFSVEPAPNTRRWPLIDPGSFIVDNIIDGLPLRLVAREPVC